MVKLKSKLYRDLSNLEKDVLQHFKDGANRAEFFVAKKVTIGGGFEPPTQLLPKNSQSWSQDWIQRHFQAYVFDSIASTVRVGTASKDKLNNHTLQYLTTNLDCQDYFHAYCVSRMLDPKLILNLAYNFLENSAKEYRTQSEAILQLEFGKFSEQLIRDRLSATVIRDAHEYSHGRTLEEVNMVISELGLKDSIDNLQESAINLTVNISHPNEGVSKLFLDRSYGLEAYRGALHALGHAIFGVVSPRIEDNLGVNIAATEVIAFQAQDLALNHTPDDIAEFLRFLHLYQSRLYAVRTIHESVRLKKCNTEVDLLLELGHEHLGLLDIKPHHFRPKLVAVDFLVAFSEYFNQEQPRDWFGIIDNAKSISNVSITHAVSLNHA